MRVRLAKFIGLMLVLTIIPLSTAAQVANPGGSFIDDHGNPHEANIEGIAAAGITRGCNPPTNNMYCPARSLTRAEMAALLIRAMGEEANLPTYQGLFPDVPAGQWYTGAVERAAQLGITTGYPDSTFRPGQVVSRAEMAALILRAINQDANLPGYQGSFSDAPNGAWFTPYVERLLQLGITTGCSPTSYCPYEGVRRDQMASFLVRAFGISPITPPPAETAVVLSVTDGDTIRVSLNGVSEPVRLIGIDAPEQNECGADQATALMSQLVSGQTVTLVKDVSERDQFNRLLRYVFVGSTWIDEQIVANGWATAVRYPPDTLMATQLEAAQASAQAQGLGIWGPNGGCVVEPPPPPPTPGCDPSYPTVCIPPPPPDLDCGQISYRNFKVLAPDPHRFDGDNDGVGCET